jgi:hypothetical protein
MEPDRPFRLSWPSWRPPPGDGVVAVVAGPEVECRWADALLARVGGRPLVWTASRGALEALGVLVAARPGVVAATLSPVGLDQRYVALTLDVARRLAAYQPDAGVDLCLTSWRVPDVPVGMVRVPHLVTVRPGGGHVEDAVVWQIASPEAVRRWAGRQVDDGDLEFVEANLDAVLRLRRAARDRSLPPTAAAARLLSLLPDGGELSIGLVYHRLGLIRVLLSAESTW